LSLAKNAATEDGAGYRLGFIRVLCIRA